jgi:hypothetical protein
MAPAGPNAARGLLHRPWFFGLATALLLGVTAFFEISAALGETQTWDEAIELAGGYRYLRTGEYRLFIEHPPFGKILVALPLLLLDPNLAKDDGYRGPDWQSRYGAEFLYRNRIPADTLLLAGRSVTILVTLALGLVLALWCRRAFGVAAALVALLLLCFDPNILAQGHYTKSGLLLTLLVLLASIVWASYLERPRKAVLLAAGVVVGLALATKFSAVFLVPVFLGLSLIRRWQRGSTLSVRRVVVSNAVVVLLGVGVLLAIYAPEAKALLPMTKGMRQEYSPGVPSLRSRMEQSTFAGTAIAWVGARLGWQVHSLPLGIGYFAAYNQRGNAAYLLGMHSEQGWWYYFPLAFLFKTPVGTLAAIALSAGLALAAAFRRRGRLTAMFRQVQFPVWVMAVPIATYVPLCLASNINTGVRHLLPAYPFLFALTSLVLVTAKWRGRVPVLGLLGLLVIAESVSIYPHFTAFFNCLVGGPTRGPHYLVDSNLDWGQDGKKLKTYMDRHGISKVCLSYFGTADLSYYGLIYEPLLVPERAASDCVLAVSATHLQGLYVPEGTFAWLRQRAPITRVGYSIYVYDLRKSLARDPGPPLGR